MQYFAILESYSLILFSTYYLSGLDMPASCSNVAWSQTYERIDEAETTTSILRKSLASASELSYMLQQ